MGGKVAGGGGGRRTLEAETRDSPSGVHSVAALPGLSVQAEAGSVELPGGGGKLAARGRAGGRARGGGGGGGVDRAADKCRNDVSGW